MPSLIRKVEKEELESLLALYQGLSSEEPPLDPGSSSVQELWDSIRENPSSFLFVIPEMHSPGSLIATCTLTVIPSLRYGGRPYGLIENVVTRAVDRGKGCGSALLRHALQVAWDLSCYKVMLMTGSKRESTLRFYEKAGFRNGVKTAFDCYAPS